MRGVTQFVVQDAHDTTLCFFGSYLFRFTPGTMAISGFVAGAEISTFLAPPLKCKAATSRLVNSPVDSTTMSTPNSCQGISPGSRIDSTLTDLPSTKNPCFSACNEPWNLLKTVSYFNKCIRVLASVTSFTATTSRPACLAALKKHRPILPKPFIPIFAVSLQLQFFFQRICAR